MVKKGRDRGKQSLARHISTWYVYLVFTVIFLMSIVCVSGCRRKGTDQNVTQNHTESAQESVSRTGGSDSSSSEGGVSGGSGLSDLPLIIDMIPEKESKVSETNEIATSDISADGTSADGVDINGQTENVADTSQDGKADAAGDGAGQGEQNETDAENSPNSLSVEEGGRYTSKDEVALYIHLFGHLPSNYFTKSEAEEIGWISNKGNLAEVAPGMSIGGDRFGNYEKKLPSENGRTYYECDINYKSGHRGSERIIFSNDGLVFYTNDHYETFEQLY